MDDGARGAAAGAAAAVIWAAASPALKRAFRTPYSDVEVIGGFLPRGPLQTPVGLAVHTVNGGVFGYLFARIGCRGVRQGVLVAVGEGTVLWPLMAIVQRVHPWCRDGTWPPLVRNPRAFAGATVGHALFGALLGALGPRR